MTEKDIKAKVEALLEGMHSGQIEYAMQLMEQAFSAQFEAEIVDARKRHSELSARPGYDAEKEFSNDLLSIAYGNKASWSGGHSVKNLCEQVKRELAIDRLRNPRRSW